ncbi:hypothetical protein HRI_000125700 [Hibiscus trionum]|uniref:Uncharacterized protein n=1 Tax=Hibiscus trionum TaxID=183268 RepID=A0A9W7LHS8_HIBTR|nr:hypothetical protein HRI_000125700 [Hibiscus trionum]
MREQCWKLHGKPGDWKSPSQRTPRETRSNVANTVSSGVFSAEQIAALSKMFGNMGGSNTANVVLKEEEGTEFEEDDWPC